MNQQEGREAPSARKAGRREGGGRRRGLAPAQSCATNLSPVFPPITSTFRLLPSFFSKQRVETHFIDPKVHFDHFSGRKDKPDLKMKVSTSIERGTTCGFDMTVFPSSADHGSIPSLVLPTGGWRPTNVPLI